jgi:RecJ-like exonuclease
MTCANCAKWTTERKDVYEDGSEIVRQKCADGKGHCGELQIGTPATFGCNAFAAGDVHVAITRKSGAPWQHFVMIPCPDCQGRGSNEGVDHRCAGTGKVRLYDDGHIGEERTRKHPKELELEKRAADEKRRAAAQAVLDGIPLPPTPEVIDGTVLKPMPKANVL